MKEIRKHGYYVWLVKAVDTEGGEPVERFRDILGGKASGLCGLH